MWEQESQKAKVRLAAKHADSISRAIRASVDVDKAVLAWLDSKPSEGISVDDIRAWADGNIFTDGDPLRNAIGKLYAEAWILGEDISDTAVLAVSNKPLMSLMATKAAVGNANWSDWKAGHRPASLLLKPPDAFAKLMASRKVDIQGINRTTTDRIGTILGGAVGKGLSPYVIAKDIRSLLRDPERALMIAQTEMSRAVSVSTRNNYERLEVEKVEWFVSDPCLICKGNQSAGAIAITATFPSGHTEPPAHPYCKCTLAPASSDLPATPQTTIGDTSIPPVQVQPPLVELPIRVVTPAVKPPATAMPESYLTMKPMDESKRAKVMQSQQRQDPSFSAFNSKLSSEAYALGRYQISEYPAMNGQLRQNRSSQYWSSSEVIRLRAEIARVDKLMDAAPLLNEQILTYRGYTNSLGFADELRNMKVGEVITEKGYASTSMKRSVANRSDFMGDEGQIVEIVNPVGTRGIFMDGFTGNPDTITEAEWLLPHGVTLVIIFKDSKTIRAVVQGG